MTSHAHSKKILSLVFVALATLGTNALSNISEVKERLQEKIAKRINEDIKSISKDYFESLYREMPRSIRITVHPELTAGQENIRIKSVQTKVALEGNYGPHFTKLYNQYVLHHFKNKGYRTTAEKKGQEGKPLFSLSTSVEAPRLSKLTNWVIAAGLTSLWAIILLSLYLIREVFKKPRKEKTTSHSKLLDLTQNTVSLRRSLLKTIPAFTEKTLDDSLHNTVSCEPKTLSLPDIHLQKTSYTGPILEPIFKLSEKQKKSTELETLKQAIKRLPYKEALFELAQMSKEDRAEIIKHLNFNSALTKHLNFHASKSSYMGK